MITTTLTKAGGARARAALGWLGVALLVALWLPGGARAQEREVDPPGRVARLAEFSGQVWLYDTDTGEWVAAVRNRPLTSGDRLATDAGARAELQIGSTHLRIDASSELEVVQLDDERIALDLHAGSAIAQVRDIAGAGAIDLSTDDGRFVIERAGVYRFDRVNDRSDITVYRGQARYEGPNSGLPVTAGQRAEFWIDAAGVAQYSLLSPVNDAFSAWSNERDRRFAGSISERYVSPEMGGVAELDAYGRWEQDAEHGSVWIPTAVAAGWAPYSQGRWTFVRPWGWTWVDDAPWGFAPFHYGRWVYARNTWCWTPGTRVARPVYAPALVAWVGGARGNVSVTVGGGPSVGWFPLAPREVYVPGYRVSPRYARNVNYTNVGNVTLINRAFDNPQAPREFQNRRHPGGVTVVSSGVFADRRPVGPDAARFRQGPGAREWANQPGRAPVLLAPPVATPALPIRAADRREVRPPPGGAERPRGEGRAGGWQRRERDESDRDGRQPARDAGRFEPRPPNVGTPTAPGGAAVIAPPGVVRLPIDATPPGMSRPFPVQRDGGPDGRADDRFGNRDDGRLENRRENRLDRPPEARPDGRWEERRGGRGFDGGPPGRVDPSRPIGLPAPPQPMPMPEAARPAPPAPPVQSAPTMRALPVQRGDDRREERREDRRTEERRPMLPPPTAPAPAVAPRPAEMPRPAPVQVRPLPMPLPAPPAAAPPQAVQRPEAPREELRRGEPRERRGDPREQQR